MADLNTTEDVRPSPVVAVADAQAGTAADRADREANPTLLQTDANQPGNPDAVEVLRRALADAESRRAEAAPREVVAADSPTGELPATVEEAQAMADYVATPKRASVEDLPGYRATTVSAQAIFEKMLIRPGDRVVVTQDVYDAADLTKKYTLTQGDTVPESKAGFVPANYISDVQRLRIIGQ